MSIAIRFIHLSEVSLPITSLNKDKCNQSHYQQRCS